MRVAPEVPPDLRRPLEDGELVRPGGEPAFSPELPQFGGDRQEGIGRGLMREIVQLGAGDLQLAASPAYLAPGDPQQEPMQTGQSCLPLRRPAGEHPHPLGEIWIDSPPGDTLPPDPVLR